MDFVKEHFFLNGHSFSGLLIVVNRSSLQAFDGVGWIGGPIIAKGDHIFL